MQENLAEHPFVPAKIRKHLESQHTDWLGGTWQSLVLSSTRWKKNM